MAELKYLDKEGLKTALNKVKSYADKHLKLTGGTVTGTVNFNTHGLETEKTPLIISRNGNNDVESAKLWIDDHNFNVKYSNDEVDSQFNLTLENTDTESPHTPSQASTRTYTFRHDGTVTGITSIDGNASSATKAVKDGDGNVITSKYVTLDTAQSITGIKTFSKIQFSYKGDTGTWISNYGNIKMGADTGSWTVSDKTNTELFHIHSDGKIGIGNSSPTEKLDVTGNIKGSGTLTVSGDASVGDVLKIGANNTGPHYIAFRGTTGDLPGNYNHGYIGERIFGTSESSELIIYKGNDIASTASVSEPGPDRIRHIAAAHLFQVYDSALSGTFEAIATSTIPKNILEINQTSVVPYKSVIPNTNAGLDLGSSSKKWRYVYGDLKGNATSADYLTGFEGRSASWAWGTLTEANGYTQITQLDHLSGAVAFATKGNLTFMQIDGVILQREGAKRVLDTSDAEDFVTKSTDQTISGVKTFTNNIFTDQNINWNQAAPGGWARGLNVYKSDNTTLLSAMIGANGANNALNYLYLGRTWNDPVIYLKADGWKVGINTTSPDELLHVNGNIKGVGTLSISSNATIGGTVKGTLFTNDGTFGIVPQINNEINFQGDNAKLIFFAYRPIGGSKYTETTPPPDFWFGSNEGLAWIHAKSASQSKDGLMSKADKAKLDSISVTNGVINASSLPSYVDDVIEGYYYNGKFYTTSAHTTEITGEAGKIYVDLETNKTYRFGNSVFVEISKSLALDNALNSDSNNAISNKAVTLSINALNDRVEQIVSFMNDNNFIITEDSDGSGIPEDASANLWYGIKKNFDDSNATCTRIGNLQLHKDLPVQSRMRGCLLADDGTVTKYLNANDWTSETRDGSLGQVMVEIPEHYINVYYDSDGLLNAKMSLYPITGFKKIPKHYVGAYQATVLRSNSKLCSVVNTTTDFRGCGNQSAWDGTYRSALGLPATAISTTNYRNYARNRNSGDTRWNMWFSTSYMSVYWLFVIEYATFNCQAGYNSLLTTEGYHQGGLGAGVTEVNSSNWNTFNGYYPFVPCGYTDSLGNNTGVVAMNKKMADDSTVLFNGNVPRYRGIENPFAHIWQWIDGYHILVDPADSTTLKSKVYVCEDPSKFNDANETDYDYIGDEARTSGYGKRIFGFHNIAKELGGSSDRGTCDYHYVSIPASGNAVRRVFLFGGHAYHGGGAGLAYSLSDCSASTALAYIGSRLCFFAK